MAKVSELAAKLTALSDQLTKAKAEIVAALADVELPAEATAALDKLTTISQAIDDLNKDATPPA